ncbi:MAG: TonB-dependent receptor plug domain-containing protein [Gemmatimonadaceae bacterium]
MSTSSSALVFALAASLAACGGGAASTPQTEPATASASGTGATTTVTNSESKFSRYSTMRDLLTGVPGLQVLGNDENYSLRVRGIQSFHGSGEPLVVVDGMPVRTGSVASTLNSMRPGDIMRVDVLKDAGSTAFYGSAGVNGVIVVTTRRARQ